MKLAFKQIDAFLKNPDDSLPVVLVYGPDEGLVRERATHLATRITPDLKDPFMVADILPEQVRATPSLLVDEAKSLSMLGGRRVVRLQASAAEGDLLKAVETAVSELLAVVTPQDNYVVIEGGDLGPSSKLRKACEDAKVAAALPCYVEDERDLTKLISARLKEQGYTIDSDALTYMAGNVVGDRGVVRGEIEKLITYMGRDNRTVRFDDVAACIGDSADLSMDLLAQRVASGRFAEAERVLKSLLADGTSFVVITRVLQNYFLRLHVTKCRMDKGDGLDTAMAKLKPAVFWKQKDAFTAQLNAWRTPQLQSALALIMSAEYKCKQTGSDPDLILSRALLALSQMAGSQRRRA